MLRVPGAGSDLSGKGCDSMADLCCPSLCPLAALRWGTASLAVEIKAHVNGRQDRLVMRPASRNRERRAPDGVAGAPCPRSLPPASPLGP